MTSKHIRLVTIRLDARGVGVPAQLAAKEVYGIFALAHPLLQTADLSNIPPLAGETVHHQMDKRRTPHPLRLQSKWQEQTIDCLK